MNDNEIIKALECCISDDKGNHEDCRNCPLHGKEVSCPEYIRESALDLINRQKAEIERSKEKNNGLALGLLYDVVNEDDKLRKEIFDVAKSEAIKEFAERLKNELMSNDLYKTHPIFESDVELFIDLIDNLVKEMEESE